MNVKLLRRVMRQKGFSVKRLAESVPMRKWCLVSRLWGISEFTFWEIQQISKLLGLSKKQITLIFFDKKVS